MLSSDGLLMPTRKDPGASRFEVFHRNNGIAGILRLRTMTHRAALAINLSACLFIRWRP
jgi:hypothetical protein